jgi:GTP-binding protein
MESGTAVKVGDTVKALSRTGQRIEQFRVTKVLAFRGLGPIGAIDRGEAGRHRHPLGNEQGDRGRHAVRSPVVDIPLPAQPIDPPTISRNVRDQRQPACRARRDEGAKRGSSANAFCAKRN